MQHYFILNDRHEPVEVDLLTFCKSDKSIADSHRGRCLPVPSK